MLNGGYKIELQDGSLESIQLVSYRYCPHFKCSYIIYTGISNKGKKNIIPLKEVEGKIYLDYSSINDEDFLLKLSKAFSISINTKKLPKLLTLEPKKGKRKEVEEISSKKEKVIDWEEVLPKKKVFTKVERVEPVEIENTKKKVLYIRCQDKKMIFLVDRENNKYYEGRELKEKDFEKNKDDYDVTYSTFSVIDYYTLEGTKNITSKNGVNTKIDKKKVIDDNIPVHGIIISYLKGFTALFLIKEVLDDSYEIEYTTYDYIKNKPFDLIKKEFITKNEFLKFYNDFVESRNNNKPLYIKRNKELIDYKDDYSLEEITRKTA